MESRLTILHDRTSTASANTSGADPAALALQSLGWILGDDARAQRLLSLTGLEPDDLRHRLDDPALLTAVLDFLCAHEPDLVAAAEALDVEPQALAEAREKLSR